MDFELYTVDIWKTIFQYYYELILISDPHPTLSVIRFGLQLKQPAGSVWQQIIKSFRELCVSKIKRMTAPRRSIKCRCGNAWNIFNSKVVRIPESDINYDRCEIIDRVDVSIRTVINDDQNGYIRISSVSNFDTLIHMSARIVSTDMLNIALSNMVINNIPVSCFRYVQRFTDSRTCYIVHNYNEKMLSTCSYIFRGFRDEHLMKPYHLSVLAYIKRYSDLSETLYLELHTDWFVEITGRISFSSDIEAFITANEVFSYWIMYVDSQWKIYTDFDHCSLLVGDVTEDLLVEIMCRSVSLEVKSYDQSNIPYLNEDWPADPQIIRRYP